MLTVSYHGFLNSGQVYHPSAVEDKIGDIIDARPELDIALVELTPAAPEKVTNNCYFRAESPSEAFRRLWDRTRDFGWRWLE